MRQGFLLIGASLGALTLTVLAGTPGAGQAQSRTPGQVFRDCADVCPQMVVVPSGSFMMGSPTGEGNDLERPQRTVTFARPFAVGRFEVTFAEWDACVRAGGCRRESPARGDWPGGPGRDEGWGRGRRPVIDVDWNDARAYVQWLSARTGQGYRLLSESEWEYAARAGTTTRYSSGDSLTADDANVREAGRRQTVPVGSFAPNAFGLFDMHGNVEEWVQDFAYTGYSGAPTNGSASTQGSVNWRTIRGGAWVSSSKYARSAFRYGAVTGFRGNGLGFRVARTL